MFSLSADWSGAKWFELQRPLVPGHVGIYMKKDEFYTRHHRKTTHYANDESLLREMLIAQHKFATRSLAESKRKKKAAAAKKMLNNCFESVLAVQFFVRWCPYYFSAPDPQTSWVRRCNETSVTMHFLLPVNCTYVCQGLHFGETKLVESCEQAR